MNKIQLEIKKHTIKGFSEMSGIPFATVARMSGSKIPSGKTIKKLAEYFNITINEVYEMFEEEEGD